MPKPVKPLTDRQCAAHHYPEEPKDKAKLFDGGGLYLKAWANGRRSWHLKYRRPDGAEDMLTFGDYPTVSLKIARERREAARKLLDQHIDPKAHEKALVARLKQDQETFESVARAYHAKNPRHWGKKTRKDFLSRMINHVFPAIGARRITSLKEEDFIPLLHKIERAGSLEMAPRVLGAIKTVMQAAKVERMIESNPTSDLKPADVFLVKRKKKHHPALPLNRLPELHARIDNSSRIKSLTRLATRLAMLTFIRSSELRFSRWKEIDFDRATWTIPPEREEIEGAEYSERGSKMHDPHLVPLTRQAVAILKSIKELKLNDGSPEDFIFSGMKDYKTTLSENTINAALRRMGYDTKKDVCLHGFRGTAQSALNQSRLFQEDAVERQMSHMERKEVRAAYIYSAEFIQEREEMMEWWADYLDANREQHITPSDYTRQEMEKPGSKWFFAGAAAYRANRLQPAPLGDQTEK